VELWGVQIGSVESISLDPEGVRTNFLIDAHVQIPQDARASVKMEGLTGVKFIDLQGGDLGGPSVPVGGEIQASETDLSLALEKGIRAVYRMDDILAHADAVLAKTESVLDNIDALTGVENRERVARILDTTAGAAEQARNAAGAVAELTQSVKRRAPPILDSLEQVGKNTQAMSEQGVVIASEIGSAAVHTQRAALALSTLVNAVRRDLPAALFQIREAALRAQMAMRSLEDNPGRLLRSRPRREIPLP
jgi:phospholipid/cholesterol/gamma-HCH transport system substrate-binding protein